MPTCLFLNEQSFHTDSDLAGAIYGNVMWAVSVSSG